MFSAEIADQDYNELILQLQQQEQKRKAKT